MNVAFITRSTFYKIFGGNGVQVTETAEQLRKLGVQVSICLAHEKINYGEFDLLHFFDIIRPANILSHINRANKPFVISPTLVDYSEYDSQHRKGMAGFVFRLFPANTNEYLKTIARWLRAKDSLPGKSYLWKGQKKSIKEILEKAALILPGSEAEYRQLKKIYSIEKQHFVIPNGINTCIFKADRAGIKDENLVICAARIEGIKNQINLIKALNNTSFTLMLIGEASPGHIKYYKTCRKIAASNIIFLNKIPQGELVNYYQKAKVHVLPSWFETCGLSSLEAAAMGCNTVITDKGYTRDYFGDEAFYCDPGNIKSIYNAIQKAANSPVQENLKKNILNNYTWEQAAIKILEAYKKILT